MNPEGGNPLKIVCFGDSNTYGYDPCSYFGDRYSSENRWVDILAQKLECKTVNVGENGREIPRREEDLFRFNKMLINQKPIDFLIVMLGCNDLLQGNDVNVVLNRMEDFLRRIDLAPSQIILIGIPPMEIGEWVTDKRLKDASEILRHKYKELALKLGINFADAGRWDVSITFDGVHFTEEGHKVFAEGLLNYLNKGE